jgi:hypothetical protein
MPHESCFIKHDAPPLGLLKVSDIPRCVNPGRSSSHRMRGVSAFRARFGSRRGGRFRSPCRLLWGANVRRWDQALCAQPDFSARFDQPMCAEPDENGPSVMVTAHCLIAIRRKVRLDAHRLIVA